MKYLNINKNRKDVDRYKFVVLFLLIVVLFGFLNIKSVKIYAIPFIFINNIIIETKKFARIGYSRFLFPHSYSGDGLGATHLGLHMSTNAEKETRYIQYGPLLLFRWYCILCINACNYRQVELVFEYVIIDYT